MAGGYICITGASSGLGSHFACQMAEKGHQLILTGRNLAALKAVQARCLSLGARACHYFQADLADLKQMTALIDYCQSQGQLAGLVHCAASARFESALKHTKAETSASLDLNLKHAILLTLEFAQVLLVQGQGGQIMLVSSVAALAQTPDRTLYATSKAGLHAFANGLRFDLAPYDIQVSSVLAGPISGTPFIEKAGQTGLNETFAIPVDRLARQMVQTWHKRQACLIAPAYYRLPIIAWALFPNLMPRASQWAFNHFNLRS
ncbi:hypothetical protein AWM75_00330 [Aerococcus urinaehominis]|uniref:Ketoreductase domain-containing protein n=1 Tax=Aerococcus urinaehominis TaxID=128944 RepID=A0A120IAM6_9LACT|nr:SDR family NAD(P)-dependent oxidoreductase [Aerococcus urinaehominis]AMB98529.1 hypothetical protein AWM75_00330 [Aerococcus urinaehominis]SDL79298.1 short chain dehydrogenase [Aerococcus urinaehominis]